MLSDPQSVTINSVAVSLALVKDEESQRTYQNSDGSFQLLTKQNVTTGRFRREARIVKNAVITDPISGLSSNGSASVYIVIDEPKVGFSDTELKQVIDGLKSFMTSTVQDRLLGGEM